MNRSLFALMLSTFALGLSEFMPMGLLPNIAADFDISIPKAGMLITSYAVGVMVASPIMTIILSRLSKKLALIILLSIFTVGSTLSILAPTYSVLVLSRIITSLAHGSFFGIGAVLAMKLSPKDKQAGAVSLMFMGLTIANIGGVSAVSLVGDMVGWRTAFMVTTALGLASIVVMLINIPKGEMGSKIDIHHEIKTLVQPSIMIVFLGTVMFSSSLFTLYTYITVVMQSLVGATSTFIAIILTIIGIGFTIGSILSGRLAINWSIDKALMLFFFCAGIIMLVYPLVAVTYAGAIIATLIWGVVGYATSPLLQTKIVCLAGDTSTLASSVNIGIFNLGNALGAVIGGAIINMGLGYEWIAPAGGIVSLLGVLTVLLPIVFSKNKHKGLQIVPVLEKSN